MPAYDPDLARLLELGRQAGKPPLEALSPEQARKAYALTWDILQPPAQEVASVRDVQIQTEQALLGLRIYRGVGTDEHDTLPCAVYLHGGGWVIGNLDSHDRLCRQLANQAGICVVSVDYRLAPEHPYPAAIDDSAAAWRWVHSHCEHLRIDASRIGVAGDSAGGNLAAALCLVQREAGEPLPGFQLLIYPATDMRAVAPSHTTNGQGYMLTSDSIAWYRGNYIADAAQWTDWRASPLLAASHAGLPPALVLTAGFDPLRDEGLQYANALSAAGVPTQYVCFERQIHGFITMGRVIEEAHTAVALCGAALRRAWGG
jgi:acetyl esterase